MKQRLQTTLLNSKFSYRQLAVFAAVFLAMGGLIVWRTSASTDTLIEAEKLSFNRGTVFTGDGGAQGVALYTNAVGSGSVMLPTKTSKLVVNAKGDQCNGAPHMTVTVNGQTVIDTDVASKGWKSYGTTVNLTAGMYNLSVRYTNDFSGGQTGASNDPTKGCDRNLYLDSFLFTGADKSALSYNPLQAETMQLKGDAQLFGAKQQIVKFSGKATATGSLVLPSNTTQIQLVARSDLCGGAPVASISIDDRIVANVTVTKPSWWSTKTGWKTYVINADLAKGSHTVAVRYDNEYSRASPRCDRNLYVDRLVFVGPAPVPTPPPAPTPQPTPPPNPKYTVIFEGFSQLNWITEQAIRAEYAQWAKNPNVSPAFRAITKSPDANTRSWERDGYKYFWTVAASDYDPGYCNDIYMNPNDIPAITSQTNNVGLYMHEVVSCYAAVKTGWDWSRAANMVDWPRVNSMVLTAKSQNKKVIWSEPSYGWQALASDPTARAYFATWGSTLVPMYANNFVNGLNQGRAASANVALTYGMQVGLSAQSWYFRDQNIPLTYQSGIDQLQAGLAIGATYYQIEGRQDDVSVQLDSKGNLVLPLFMQSVNGFVASLPKASNPGPIPAPQPKPDPKAKPKKVPLYQLWNNVTVDHMYTTSESVRADQMASGGYEAQGVAGYVYDQQVPGSVPLYALWSPVRTDHFYTIDLNQKAGALNGIPYYIDQGVIGYVMPAQTTDTKLFRQLWTDGSPNGEPYADHFYTADEWQRDNAKNSFRHYIDLGSAGYIW